MLYALSLFAGFVFYTVANFIWDYVAYRVDRINREEIARLTAKPARGAGRYMGADRHGNSIIFR
jgi:hypothetical protein